MELLVVTAIVAVLAGLLVASVGRSRIRGTELQCLNNVRYWSGLLTEFVAENNAYPLAANPLGSHPGHRATWSMTLWDLRTPPGRPSDNLGVWKCPSVPVPAGKSISRSLGALSYGYNSWGMGDAPPGGPLLGLGGDGGEGRDSSSFGSMTPIRESQVVAPAETYALGDKLAGWNGRVTDEWGWMARTRLVGAWPDHGGDARASRRHAGRANIGFCDGHAEPVPLRNLFADESDEALRRWNRDHEPHRELLNPP